MHCLLNTCIVFNKLCMFQPIQRIWARGYHLINAGGVGGFSGSSGMTKKTLQSQCINSDLNAKPSLLFQLSFTMCKRLTIRVPVWTRLSVTEQSIVVFCAVQVLEAIRHYYFKNKPAYQRREEEEEEERHLTFLPINQLMSLSHLPLGCVLSAPCPIHLVILINFTPASQWAGLISCVTRKHGGLATSVASVTFYVSPCAAARVQAPWIPQG